MNLHKLIESGDHKKIRELLKNGAVVDERDEDGRTPLMAAATYNLSNIFKMLLEAGADPGAVDAIGNSVLHSAATFGAPSLVQLLLDRKPNVNVRNSLGETPLMGVLSAKIVQLLIDAGADVNLRRNDGRTALDLHENFRKFNSGREGKIEQLLRQAGAGKETGAASEQPRAPLRLPPRGTGPLASPSPKEMEEFLTAAQTDDSAKVRQLIESGIPLEIRNGTAQSALHLAAQRGCLGVARLLLEAGADRNARDSSGSTALHLAAQENKAEVARALVEAGCDANARNGMKSTPLMMAAAVGALKVAQMLIEAGAVVNVRNANDRSALAVACSKEMKELLRQAGADDKKAETIPDTPAEALIDATAMGDVAKLHELLAAGVPVNACVRFGDSAIARAADRGHLEAFQVLQDAGASLQQRDLEGNTLLHAAAWGGNAVLVRHLIENGMDVNAANLNGITPLMVAAMEGHLELVRTLLEAGANREARGSWVMDKNKTALEFARHIENRKERQAMLALLSGGPATADPVESARETVLDLERFSQEPAFQKTLKLLAKVFEKAPTPSKEYEGVYACARPCAETLAKHYSRDKEMQEALKQNMTLEKRARLLLDRLQRDVRAAGFHLVETQPGQTARTAKLLIIPTSDKYAVIAALETNGVNHGQSTQDIISWLREMEKENPFALISCGHDHLGGEFLGPVVDAGALAERMARFCPDLIDGEQVESAGQLAPHLESGRGFFLWWD